MRFSLSLWSILISAVVSAQEPLQSFYIDLGPDDGTNGNATLSPDENGTHWNNLTRPAGGEVITLANAMGVASTYSASVTERLSSNGINHGGLLGPLEEFLGEFAIATATQDYFFTNSSGRVTLEGLNPANAYRLSYFATRLTGETRVTEYRTTGQTEDVGQLQTSGPGSGSGGYGGNNDDLYVTALLPPTTNGRISIDVLRLEGSFGYLGLIKVEEFTDGEVVEVTTININGPTTINTAGASVQYTAEVLPQDATFTGVTWSIDNPFVAHIDDSGLLTVLNDGSVTITARSTEPGTSVFAQTTVAVSGQNGRSVLVDCGRPNSATPSPDAFGQSWNNVTSSFRGQQDPIDLVTTSGDATGWRLDVTRSASTSSNDVAAPGDALGSLGVATAGIDYFFTGNTGTLTLRGLDPNRGYRLLALGSWATTDPQSTRFILSGLNAATSTVQTSGPGAGRNDTLVNDNTLAITELAKPFPDSTLEVSFSASGGVFGILNAFQVFEYDGFELCPERDATEIVVLGSSVARGQGAPGDRGYAFQYGRLLNERFADGESDRHWMVTNVSVGGDNTERVLARFGTDLVGQCGSYVIIGLSLANEGIRNGGQEVYDQFQENMLLLIERSRAAGYEPVIVSNYPRGDYDAGDYEFIRDINQWIYQLDVPSVNVLGPVDDGNGRWLPSLQDDIGHPNLAGHEAFASAFVPSLFDALDAEKPVPEYQECCDLNLLTINDATGQLHVAPEAGLKSFSFGVDFRTDVEASNLLRIEDALSDPRIGIDASGRLILQSATSAPIILTDSAVNDNSWHRLMVTYQQATENFSVYLDAQLLAETTELAIEAPEFTIVGAPPLKGLQVRQIVLYRANLNAEEIALWQQNVLLQGSLEIYALGDAFVIGGAITVINYAQSTNQVRFDLIVSTDETAALPKGSVVASPNPTNGVVQLMHQAGKPITSVVIHDAVGRYVTRTQSTTLDTATWPKGIYYARVLIDDRVGVVRFVVE